jgi:hypothetical protein
MLLILDSLQRFSGTNTNFKISLDPGITFNKVRLKFANICNSSNNTEPFYLISIDSLQMGVRGSNAGSCSAQFVVPTTSPANSRNLHQEMGDFTSVTDGAAIYLNELHVRIHHQNGVTAPDSGSNLLILEILP